MPIEQVRCDNCGSGDVRQLAADAYECEHCHSRFHWVDPTKRTVVQRASVCRCGVVAVAYCARCEEPLCECHLQWEEEKDVTEMTQEELHAWAWNEKRYGRQPNARALCQQCNAAHLAGSQAAMLTVEGDWYYEQSGQRFGPVPYKHLQHLRPDDLAWHAGLADWVSVGEVRQMFSIPASQSTFGGPPTVTPLDSPQKTDCGALKRNASLLVWFDTRLRRRLGEENTLLYRFAQVTLYALLPATAIVLIASKIVRMF